MLLLYYKDIRMASELGQKLLPEGSDTLARLTAQDRGIQTNLILHIRLGSNDGGWDKSCHCLPIADVTGAELRVYTIEDDDVMGVDGVALAESLVLLHASDIPRVDDDCTVVGLELNGKNFGTDGGLVDLLKLVVDLALEESALANATIAHEDNLIDRGSHFL